MSDVYSPSPTSYYVFIFDVNISDGVLQGVRFYLLFINLRDVYVRGFKDKQSTLIIVIAACEAMMSSDEDYINKRNANETSASSSLIKTVILSSLSSNHLHASSSGNMWIMERINMWKELSQLLVAERGDELPHNALTREHIALLVGAMQNNFSHNARTILSNVIQTLRWGTLFNYAAK